MFYLTDAAISGAIAFTLVIVAWQGANVRCTSLENTVLGAGLLLGLFGTVPLFTSDIRGVSFVVFAFIFLSSVQLFLFRDKRWQNLKSHALSFCSGVLQLRGVELLLALYLLFISALTFFLCLAPPNANDYDSLVYHLAAPARYLAVGRVVELPYDHHTYFPFLTEMLFALGLKWSGSVLAKLFHWLMLPLCCTSLMAIGARHFSRRVGLVAACLFASIPLVQIEATTAYVDLSLSAFVLLSFLCFLNWLQTRQAWWIGYAGVMCGFAMGTKYSGALFFGWLLLWAIFTILLDKKRTASVSDRLSWKPVFAFTIFALLLGGGWYLRNILWVGNPVFPFAYEIFGGQGWTTEMAKAYTRDQAGFGFGRGILDWILLPFRASMAPLNSLISTPQGTGILPQPLWPVLLSSLENSDAVGRFEVQGHIVQTLIGPAFLAFGAPLVWIKHKPRVIGFLLWTFLFLWIFWAATSQQLRYLIPSLALLSIPCAWGVLQMQSRGPLLKWTIGICLFAWLMFAPILTAWRLRDAIPVALGQENPEAFLTRTFAGYDAMKWASEKTAANATFAIYGEPRNFYLKRNYFWADDPHNNLIDYSQIKTGAQLARAWKNLGATHILWNTRFAQNGGFGAPPPQIEDAIARGLISEIYASRGYRVFKIQ